MIHDIHIPDSKGEWPIAPTDSVTFTFDDDISHFNVTHSKYFKQKIPSGAFRAGNSIGPYEANAKKKNTTFKYTPDNGPIAARLVTTHTILIGD